MKKVSFFVLLCCFLIQPKISSQSVPIKSELFGINAWYIDARGIGTSTFATTFTAQLAAVKASGVTHVRIGGIGPNWDHLYNFDPITKAIIGTSLARLQDLITEIRTADMEPIIQVSCAPPQWTTNASCATYTPASGYNSLGNLTIAQQATVAANLVYYINSVSTFSSNFVKYWIIANEPDHSPKDNGAGTPCLEPRGYGLDGTTSPANDASVIGDYVRKFSEAMKGKDQRITIIGPELAAFGNDDNWKVNNVMEELLSPLTNTRSILGMIPGTSPPSPYVDIVSFHHYPGIEGTFTTTTLIQNHPANHVKCFAENLRSTTTFTSSGFKGLINMITQSGTGRSVINTSLACTEFNIDMRNVETFDESTGTGYQNMINGISNRGFLGGQWLAEMFAEGMKCNDNGIPWVSMMNLWSTREGGCTEGQGYITSCATPSGNAAYAGAKRPMYWHYEMVANHFKGTFYPCTSTSLPSDVKAFAAKSNDRIAVMLLNQSSTDYDFGVKLNGTPSSGTLKFPFNILGTITNTEYIASGSSSLTATLKANSTVLLIYNCTGNISERRDYTRASVLASAAAQPTTTVLGPGLIGAQISMNGPGLITNSSGTFTFAPSNYTFSWQQPGPCGTITTGGNGTTAVLSDCNAIGDPEIYSFTVTDTYGCTLPQQITISGGIPVGGGFYAGVGSITGADCGSNNGVVNISANCSSTAGCSYSWDGGSTWTASHTLSALSAGSHTAIVKDVPYGTPVGGSTVAVVYTIPTINRPPVNAGNDFYAGTFCTVTLSAFPDLSGSGYTYY